MPTSNSITADDKARLREVLRERASESTLHEKDIAPTKAAYESNPGKTDTGVTITSYQIQKYLGDGKWIDAVRDAGLLPATKRTKAEVIEQFQTLSGEPPHDYVRQEEFVNHPETVSMVAIRDKFGNYSTLIEAAGYEYPGAGPKPIPKAEIIEQIQQAAANLYDGKRAPSSNEFDDLDDTVSKTTVSDRFGSYNAAVRAAGFEPQPRPEDRVIPEEEIIEGIQMLAEDGKPPTQAEFAAHPETPGSGWKKMGGWNAAVEQAGFQSRSKGHKMWKSDVVEHLQRLAVDGKMPTEAEVKADDDAPNPVTIRDKFGSWDDARNAAGLDRDAEGSDR